MSKRSVNTTVIVMMAITLLGKLMGIARESLRGARFGPDTAEGVAFLQASVLPRTFLDLMFASIFSASFIPIFNKYLETKGKKAAFDLAALFISVTLVLTTAITIVFIIFAGPLYGLLQDGSGLPDGTRELAVPLLRLMFPLITLSGLAFSLTGVVQSLGEFKAPAAMSVASNGIIILYYFLFADRFGVWGLAVAFLIGWAAQVVIQVPFLWKQGFRFRFKFSLKDEGLTEVLFLALPVMAASWIGPVNMLAGGRLVSEYGGTADYNGLYAANDINTIVSGVFVLSVANVIFPRLSKQAAVNDEDGLKKTLADTLKTSLFFLLPMSLGLAAVAKPLVRIIFEFDLFGGEAVEVTASALTLFAFGIVGYGLQIILSRVCYALRDARTPTLSAIAAMAANLILCVLLSRFIAAINAAAIAGTVSISISAVWLVIVLARRGLITGRIQDYLKMAALAILTYAAAAACVNLLHDTDGLPISIRLINVAAPVLLGAGIYLGGAWLLKINWRIKW
jgi:putative peptidoglycan lipid II flippase